MTKKSILIAGAGIGGLTTALALADRGFDSIVIEKETRVEEAGAGIQLSPNASRVLIGLGLGPALERFVSEPARLRIRSGRHGGDLAGMELGAAMRARHGAPYWTIHRADLQSVLLDAVRGTDRIRLAFGRSVAGIEAENEHGITIQCRSETTVEAVDGAALIGADGLWSLVARHIGDVSEPEFRHYIAWRGICPADNWPGDIPKSSTGLWLGRGAHLVHYPIRGGRSINVVAITADRDSKPGWSRPGDASVLLERFRAWHPLARKALSAVPDWSVWSLRDRPPRRFWTKGRITLLGDAAHPILPFLAQGGALAIEDAAVIAAELAAAPDAPGMAFARYEARRKPRGTRVQAEARRNASIYHLPWPASSIRDIAMKRLQFPDMYDWLYGWTPDA